MKILSVHNFYQRSGGEDQIYANEAAILEMNGHSVVRYEARNDEIRGTGAVFAGAKAIWNWQSHRTLRSIVAKSLPNVAHFHNTFPLVSPSGYYAAGRHGIPVVQELQNFRLLCPGATFLRDGNVCEDCIKDRSLMPALAHRCYRGSLAATSAVVAMLSIHRAARTWHRMVNVYIAPSEFVRRKYVDSGFSCDRVAVKPNPILSDPGTGDGCGGYALFVGRLSPEKGIRSLVDAWQRGTGMPLKVAGDGPLNTVEWPNCVEWLGQQSRERVIELMKNATVLIFPSIWYEGQPVTILEALACGLPVIASDIGSIPELITNHHNGLLFRPGDAEDLARKVRWVVDNPERMREMRVAARREYETKYTAEINYKQLIGIYEMAIENARAARG